MAGSRVSRVKNRMEFGGTNNRSTVQAGRSTVVLPTVPLSFGTFEKDVKVELHPQHPAALSFFTRNFIGVGTVFTAQGQQWKAVSWYPDKVKGSDGKEVWGYRVEAQAI